MVTTGALTPACVSQHCSLVSHSLASHSTVTGASTSARLEQIRDHLAWPAVETSVRILATAYCGVEQPAPVPANMAASSTLTKYLERIHNIIQSQTSQILVAILNKVMQSDDEELWSKMNEVNLTEKCFHGQCWRVMCEQKISQRLNIFA